MPSSSETQTVRDRLPSSSNISPHSRGQADPSTHAGRDKPTPYSQKASAGSYFDLESGPPSYDAGSHHSDTPALPASASAGLLSPSEAVPLDRTFTSLESGLSRPSHGSIISSLLHRGPGGPHKGEGGPEERPAWSYPQNSSAVSRTVTEYCEPPGPKHRPSIASGRSYRERVQLLRRRSRAEIVEHVEDYEVRQKFIVRLAKALLSFGAPSHRIESQLNSAAHILGVNVGFVHLPSLIIVSFLDNETRTSETHFVRAGGRVALTALHKVHLVYRDVLHDKIGAGTGTRRLRRILKARPIYSIWLRCMFAFICASIICTTAFGGALVDMFVSGASASILQYLGLNAATKSSIYANVYEISVSIIVSFLARLLGTLPGNIFCYSAISSAGVVLILPGFTILISALELTSRNILCGSVRMVYAIIYTLFLGFGLTIGSDLYLVINKAARRNLASTMQAESDILHGRILVTNTSTSLSPLGGTFTFLDTASRNAHFIKGCYRNPAWPWYRQPFPFWTLFFLVPIYSTCSSLANLQTYRSIQLPVMVLFSCLAYAANKGANELISDRGDIVSAFGALVIGLCGNLYSRLVGGTAFTSMVTGVLFLVPSAIGNGGGLIQNFKTSTQRYSSSFELGIRMIQVSIGVTIGLFVAQILVYALGRRKNAAHFAF